MKRAIIFTRTKVGATKLASRLRQRGYRAAPIHSDRSQNERVATLEAFRAGKVHLLVATDIAARGIDVDHVGHVVNYDVPFSAEDYVHRIGRTARAGRTGMAIMLATSRDRANLNAIERLVGFSLSGNGRKGSAAKRPQPVSAESGNRNSGSGSRRRRRGGRRDGRPEAAVAATATAERAPIAERSSAAGPEGSRHRGARRRRSGRQTQADISRSARRGSSTEASTRRRSSPESAPLASEVSQPASGIFQSVLGRIFRRQRPEATPEAARL